MSFSWPKVCTNCGRSIRKTTWRNLPKVGEMGPKGADPESCFELRNCECGSTIMVPVRSAKPTDPPPPPSDS